jgi:hypothetical protein
MRKRKLTLKNADAFIDPGVPDVVFLIEKVGRHDDYEEPHQEQRAVAYMRHGAPTLALELDSSRVLSLRSQCAVRTQGSVRTQGYVRTQRLMNIVSMELHNRRADLVLLEVSDI